MEHTTSPYLHTLVELSGTHSEGERWQLRRRLSSQAFLQVCQARERWLRPKTSQQPRCVPAFQCVCPHSKLLEKATVLSFSSSAAVPSLQWVPDRRPFSFTLHTTPSPVQDGIQTNLAPF